MVHTAAPGQRLAHILETGVTNMVHIGPHRHMCSSAQSHPFKHTPISQRCLHEMWICKQSSIEQHPPSHKRLPRDPYQVPLAYFPPFCYLTGVQMRAGPAADNETGGTNGCKSAPIINPHSFHRVSLILNESSLAHILPTFTKNVAQILCHFYPLLTLHLNHIREDIR